MIEFRDGDLLQQEDVEMIAHQVNCKGAMNSGIAKQIREKYPDNFEHYKSFCALHYQNNIELGGKILVTKEFDGKHIVNLFSQGNYGYDGRQYTDYSWFRNCIESVVPCAEVNQVKVIGIPYKIGCVRGGGDWNIIYKILEDTFKDSNLQLVICKYDKG